jgi:transcriptional regulator with XRE-family HTH domain
VARLKLDEEMRPFRRAAVDKNQTPGLLREVRRVLEIPVKEIAERTGLERSGIYDIEERELEGRATMGSLVRLAAAMDCGVVYGIVPRGGRTLEELYTERLWARLLGTEIRE